MKKLINFFRRYISIKQLWLEIIEKIGCSKSVRPSTDIYIIYITRTDFEHHFPQLFRVRVILSKLSFHKKCFFLLRHEKMLYIQNWWTIPSKYVTVCENSQFVWKCVTLVFIIPASIQVILSRSSETFSPQLKSHPNK